MKTYLVPVDFSETSIHAAKFAAALSKQTDVERIFLLNAYFVSSYETVLPNPDMVLLREEEIEENTAERIRKLEQLKRKLQKLVRPGVEINTHVNRSHLLDAVAEHAVKQKADVVIMGSIGNTSTDDTEIGSHVMKVSQACPVPVVVVPPNFKFEAINRVVIACDFSKIVETVPMAALKKLLNNNKYELLVVNVDNQAKHVEGSKERVAEEAALSAMLQEYSPQYYYISETDVIKGILQFAADHDAQLVITLPHTYTFFQSLLHTSVSRRLAETSSVPVLLLK